jgi:alpha-D-ribose 1-methylphosphonate 5-triphosphate synthase subunit PhnG
MPRLFVERLLGGDAGVVDLTFRCHDGTISVAFVATRWKSDAARAAYFTAEGALIDRPVEGAGRLAADPLAPGVFVRAAELARRLSVGLDQIRIDFIVDGEDIYLGEFTVYSASGFGDEERVGVGPTIERAWLAAIDQSWFLSTPHQGWRVRYAEAFRRWVPKRLAELG